ncbi:MAG: helix-turn-helix domain-containing protein [Rhodobacterales bacterium]|nr:helix-turn-helix domain-containing protein [Rhodobacterales bacterium]
MADGAAENVARNIRALREIRGWTQQRLADRSGVHRATWAHLESGYRVRLVRAGALERSKRSGVQIPRMLPDHHPAREVDRVGAVELGSPTTIWATLA